MTQIAALHEVQEYPLVWPERQPRTPAGRRERNPRGWDSPDFWRSLDRLEAELSRSAIRDYRLSANLRPHSRATVKIEDPGAALWFMQRVRDKWVLSVLACDRYEHLWQNVRAIELTLQRTRLIAEYGCYTAEQAMQGAAYQALPPPSAEQAPAPPAPWFTVLGVFPEAPIEVIEAAYRALAKKAHPDQGGSEEEMARLNRAIDEARKARG